MAVEITMPQLSDTMSEGRILSWYKNEGDAVKRGEALAEVATDKADLEIESFHEGTLLKILTPAGSIVKVGAVIAVLGEAGESISASSAGAPQEASRSSGAAATAPVSQPSVIVAPAAVEPEQTPAPEEERVKISPLARNIAQSHHVDVSQLKGTGEGGRILRRDVEAILGSPAAVAAPSAPVQIEAAPEAAPHRPVVSAGAQALSRMRQTIAARMVESKTTIPHFYMTSKMRAEGLLRLKASLKPLPAYEGLTINHLIMKAAALALRAVPRLNASFVDGQVRQPEEFNIGIVTAIPDGLLIPVVKRADQLLLSDLVVEAKGLVQRARAGRPRADDLVGATFSISNMGMFPVESFSAIISPGQGAMLAVGSISDEAVVANGSVVAGKVTRITLSVDHRIIDGVAAGEYLKELQRLIEDPVLLLA